LKKSEILLTVKVKLDIWFLVQLDLIFFSESRD